MSDDAPSPNGENGDRGSDGRFLPGNAGGPGNPYGHRTAELRRVLLQSVQPSDLRKIIGKVVEAAKAGEPWAVRELLDRLLGKPTPATERLDEPERKGIRIEIVDRRNDARQLGRLDERAEP